MFNPIKEETAGMMARRQVWSTEAINLALTGLNEGRKLIANPFYENNTKILKADLVFERSEEEIQEFKHCMEDIIYFAEKYCKLMTPTGIRNVELRDYQKKYLQHLMDSRLSIYLACRQCGKTTTSAIFLLHYILFNTDKNSLVLGNKRKTAVEILDKIKKIYFEIPYFLKPGILKWNEGEIVLDNGCRCLSEATTINSGISFTFHCVLADEFAHIQDNIKDKFYNNLFPTITAGKARFMITSTQNGYDLFYRLYKAAEAGENEYKPFKTDWWEVPEWDNKTQTFIKRDEEWHRTQVANYGSEEAFNKQFGTAFDVHSATLISSKVLKQQASMATEYVNKEMPEVIESDNFYWHPEFDVESLRKMLMVITIDISEGLSQDYTVFTINNIFNNPSDSILSNNLSLSQETLKRYFGEEEIKTETVGFFKNNNLGVQQCANVLYSFCSTYFNNFNILVSVEHNMYGELFVNYFKQYILEGLESNFSYNSLDESVIIKFDENKKHTGIKITKSSKSFGLALFKKMYETGTISNKSIQFVNELYNFGAKNGSDTYQALFGHDDLVMSQMQIVFCLQTPHVKNHMYYFNESKNNKSYQNFNFDNIYN